MLCLQVNQLLTWLEGNLAYSILICFALFLAALLIILILAAKSRRLERHLAKLESAVTGIKPGETHDTCNYDLQLKGIEKKLSSALQHVAMVRFNAFENEGSGLSFALAVMDDNGDGFVISSLYGREETRTYAKQIIGGKPSHPLSPEEEEAIRKALINSG